MKRIHLLHVALVCLLPVLSAAAQEKGYWHASSKTAKGLTGDLSFTDSKLTINFSSYTIAQIRTLDPTEAQALFSADPGGQGNLYRLSIPADKRFLHKNTICGSEETQWAITYVTGRSLQLAFFSGSSIPTLTAEALADPTRLCGIYSYTR
jgi:hypothetical protein